MRGDKYRYWNKGIFPDLEVQWFHDRGVSDPEWVHDKWNDWLKKTRTPEARFRKALALAVGIKEAAVGHYLSHWNDPAMNRAEHLGLKTRKDLDETAASLGCPPPYPFAEPIERQEGGHLRILLLAELARVPSPRFHLAVLGGIARACDRFNFSVAVRELRQSDPDIAGTVARIVRSSFPHGIIWLRLPPNAACLDAISRYSNHLPCVLVHASRLRYPPPAIAHVVPIQELIANGVTTWARRLPDLPSKDRKVVVVAMEAERLQPPFAPMNASVPASIRGERIELVVRTIRAAELEPVVEHVDDYGASQAARVLDAQTRALGYVCLSDEIAVSLKQLLSARGEETEGRILGFDGSDLAAEHHVPSFDQQLNNLGERVVEQFLNWFRRRPKDADCWPTFDEVGVDVLPPSL